MGWFTCALIVCIYLFIVFGLLYRKNLNHSRLLRESHFLLSVFCRAENNRLYLRHGIEMRPGYCAKWIEFKLIQLAEHADVITHMRARFLKQNIDSENPRTKFGNDGLPEDNFGDPNMLQEQKEIENDIMSHNRMKEL